MYSTDYATLGHLLRTQQGPLLRPQDGGTVRRNHARPESRDRPRLGTHIQSYSRANRFQPPYTEW